jgi:hypothetical protein
MNQSDDTRIFIWGLNFNEEQVETVDLSIPRCRINAARLRRFGNPTGDTSLMTYSGMTWTEQVLSGLDPAHVAFTMQDAEINILILDVTPLARVDFDNDGDVDQSDFAVLQRCFSGSTVAQNDSTCEDALLDGDNDVDIQDLARFMTCYSGPANLADYQCAD